MLTIENLLLSSDIHRLYLIETPQIILLQFLKQWMSSVKTQFSEGKKRAFFSRKNPVFLPSNHNWSVFLLRKNGFAAGLLSGTGLAFRILNREQGGLLRLVSLLISAYPDQLLLFHRHHLLPYFLLFIAKAAFITSYPFHDLLHWNHRFSSQLPVQADALELH